MARIVTTGRDSWHPPQPCGLTREQRYGPLVSMDDDTLLDRARAVLPVVFRCCIIAIIAGLAVIGAVQAWRLF